MTYNLIRLDLELPVVDGKYDFFPFKCGRGWRPCSTHSNWVRPLKYVRQLSSNIISDTEYGFIFPCYVRTGVLFDSDDELIEIQEKIKQVNGKLFVRSTITKRSGKAWQIHDVHFIVRLTNKNDLILTKLILGRIKY